MTELSTQAGISLPSNEVHLWCADPYELRPEDVDTAARTIISTDEAQRLARLVFAQDRLVYLATRVLVRTVLSRYEPVAPEAWRFAVSAHGRPEILGGGQPPLRFNLSNTKGLVVCAVVREVDIGVDAEHLGQARLDLADRYFAPAEVAVLRRLSRREQPRRFYEYWTLKESYIKARSLGLALPLDRFAFLLEPGRPPRIEIDPELDDDGESWQFMQRRPTAHHVVSLCVRRRERLDASIALRWQPLRLSLGLGGRRLVNHQDRHERSPR